MISGFSILGYIFTPAYFSVKIKTHTSIQKVLDFISIFTLINLSTGAILILVDSEIGYYISLIGIISLTGLFIPILIYIIIKNKKNRLKRIIILGASIVFLVGNIYLSSIIEFKPQIIDSYSIIDFTQNDRLPQYQPDSIDYSYLLKTHPEKDKIKKLKNKSDSISNYIHELKTEIIQKYSGTDSLLNQILFKQGKASELKKELENYKTFIESEFLNHIDSVEFEKKLSLKINNPEFSKSWEDEYFNHIPMAGVVAILASFQSNVRYIENSIIEDMK